MAEAKSKVSWLTNPDILVAIGVIGVVVMLIIPMPTFLLDFFIAINMASSLIVDRKSVV